MMFVRRQVNMKNLHMVRATVCIVTFLGGDRVLGGGDLDLDEALRLVDGPLERAFDADLDLRML